MSLDTSFYSSELQRALKEQGAAIQTFDILETSNLQASASVCLLEGTVINITLTMQGYKIDDNDALQVFETLEDLLHSVSPLHAQTRSQSISDALRHLANTPTQYYNTANSS